MFPSETWEQEVKFLNEVDMEEAMTRPNIMIPTGKIAEFCLRNHVRKLAFFGSVLREDFSNDSDIDVLVEFELDHVPGLAFFGMEAELAEILGRRVELHTPAFLSPYFRDKVIAESEIHYVAS